MKISVVIPNYNGVAFLTTCLESLFKQTYDSYEVIVVDNGSTDQSCDYIKDNFPEVHIINLWENYGFSAAVNVGIKTCRGEYVALLNNDTEVDPNWLKALVHCLEQDKRIFAVSSKMIRFHQRDIIDDAGEQYTLVGWAFKRGEGLSGDKYDRDEEIFSACGGAACYRKSVFDKIGYFDERFFAYIEDVDISYRARIHGYRNVFCSKAIVYHIGSGTSGGQKYNQFKVRLSAQNNVFNIVKNMPIVQLIINSPFLLMGLAAKAVFFWRNGYLQAYKEGLVDGLRGLKDIERVPMKWCNLTNYILIEWLMISGLLEYVGYKFFKQ